jgi:hypothetical protein
VDTYLRDLELHASSAGDEVIDTYARTSAKHVPVRQLAADVSATSFSPEISQPALASLRREAAQRCPRMR